MNPNLFFKKMTLVLALAGICTSLSAEPIGREEAQKRAEQFLQKVGGSRRLSPVTRRAKLGPSRTPSAARADVDLYYVFNRGEGEGYVIATADDQVMPVLGYTDQGEFDYELLPTNMRAWLKGYEDELALLRERPELLSSAPRYAPVHDAIEPMVTTRWNQTSPYNDECPMYFNLGRSITGCVATAMAQVLNYWADISVTEIQADIPAYVGNTTHPTFGHLNVEGIAAGEPIDWNNMLDTYGASATGVQKKAVAQLMHYCGVSVKMDYTNSQSAAYTSDVANAVINYFGYDNNVRYVQGSNYTADGWDALLYAELSAGRPFYLSGANADGGHAFVCDGYDGNRCFHINWGWGGQSDGYFLINRLNPASQGPGGSDGGYSDYAEAVIGMQPPVNTEKEMAISNSTVKRICLTSFDSDGDGRLTYAEVEAVKDLGTAFRGARITTFPELYNFTGLTSLPDSAFAGCTQLSTVRLPKQLTAIGKAAFWGCKALKQLSIPEGVRTIGDDAFNGCTKLSSFILPQSVTEVGDRAFKDCATFTTVTLPIAIQRIGSEAYAGCSKLTDVTVNSILPQNIKMADDAFADNDLTEVTLNVTQGTYDFFAQTAPWNTFGHIHQMRNLAQGNFTSLVTNTKLYLYNVGTGRYLTRGEAYGTQAVVAETDEPMRFELRHTSSMGTDVYALYTQEMAASGNYLFRTSTDNRVGQGVAACFVDGSMETNGANTYWKVTEVDNNTYTFQIPSNRSGYKAGQYLGINTAHASNEASPTYGAYSDVEYDVQPLNCQWMLVPYDADRMALFAATRTLENLLQTAATRHVAAPRELAVMENMDATLEDVEKAQRSLRKRLGLIQFADDAVRRICVNQWDSDADNELSFTEAKSVDYLWNAAGFQDDKTITSFDEFQYFTNANSIFYYAFRNCTSLRSIVFPDGMEELSYYAFTGCKALERVEFGRNIGTIGERAFENCTALSEVRLPVADPASIDVDATAFRNVKLAQATLYVPIGSRERYAQADVWKQFGTIKEMRTTPQASFSELKEDETVYVYNLGSHRYLTNGEAYGTQAVVGKSGLQYQLKRTSNMSAGQYYLYASDYSGTSKYLFRTNADSQVGQGVKACFVDGTQTANAYWQVKEVDAERHIYTIQVPSSDGEYADGVYLGWDYTHPTNYTYSGTYGVFYDVPFGDSPEDCQWAFIRIADIDSIEAQAAKVVELKTLIGYADARDIDAAAEQAVYDNLQATPEEIETAIGSLRVKLHYIEFADTRAKAISINNWDEDEDDELSLEEAAAVKDLGTAFRTATGMKNMEELRYFTSLTTIPAEAFRNSTSLHYVYLPEGVTTIGKNAFVGCNALKYLVLLNPTQVVPGRETSVPSDITVFVPAQMLAAYQADAFWSAYRIVEFTEVPVVQADAATRQYGRANPTFTFSVTGAPIEGEPAMTCDAETATPVGQYEIRTEAGSIVTPGVKLTNGVLTIEPAPLTITAVSYTRNVGEPNPEFELTYRTFRNREKADVLRTQATIQCDATTDSPAGVYEIRVSGAEADNYAITFVNGTLTVIDPAGIAGIKTDRADDMPVYDLSGRRMAQQPGGLKLKKGVYIVNGQKKVMK